MLLRSSISSTKKFFQKTIKNFKSLFSPGYYERLPKSTPPHNNHFSYSSSVAGVNKDMDMINNNNNNTSYQELDKYYNTEFSDQLWDSDHTENKAKRRSKNKKDYASLPSPTTTTTTKQDQNEAHDMSLSIAKKNKKREGYENKNQRNFMVEQKLRELEMLDMSNVDYVLDIEEVLHYYSRLTCPAYLEIVDRFFMDMYSESFAPAWPAATPSRMKLR